jgi:tetratricopeptide (TPR) repeat protein
LVLARWWPATWLILPFGMVGLIWAGRGAAPAWLLKWVVLSQAVAILPFFVNARFRQPLIPLLALFAAAGAVHLVQAARTRRWLPLAVLIIAAVFVNVDWYGLGHERWLARDHFNQGLIFARAYGDRAPDLARTEQHFRRALELDPTDVDATERYGALYLSEAQPLVTAGQEQVQQGRFTAAEKTFSRADYLLVNAQALHRKALKLFPRSFRSWANLGTCQMWLADVQGARARARQAQGDTQAAANFAADALARYDDARVSLNEGLKVNRSLADVRRQLQIIETAAEKLSGLAFPGRDGGDRGRPGQDP